MRGDRGAGEGRIRLKFLSKGADNVRARGERGLLSVAPCASLCRETSLSIAICVRQDSSRLVRRGATPIYGQFRPALLRIRRAWVRRATQHNCFTRSKSRWRGTLINAIIS